jgi:hypothetical protein
MIITQQSHPRLWTFSQQYVMKSSQIAVESGTEEEINQTEKKLSELTLSEFEQFLDNPYDERIMEKLGTCGGISMEIIAHLKQMGW